MPKTKPSPQRPADEPAAPRTLSLEATATIHLEAAGGEGAAPLPRFRMVAYSGAPMRVAGWRHPVVLDLAGISIPSQSRPIRFGHDPLAGVGHTDAVRVEDGQLVATGIVSRDTPAAREVVTSAKNGFPWQASVGASVEEFEFVKENQQVLVNGQTLSGPLNVVRKATLGEISFVDLGADGRTSASVAANQNTGDPSVPTETETDPTAEEVRARAVAETNRIAAVRRICAGRCPEIEAEAIRDGWYQTRTELEVLRRTRPASPVPHGGGHTPVNARMLEAACLLTAKLDNVERLVDAQTLELAAQRFKGGVGLQELLLEAAWANGYTGRNFRDSRAVLRYAFGRGVEAGFSTIDIGGILSNVANKFLLDGFFSVERTWRNVCAVRNVSDFKTVTSYRLVGKDQYEQVAPGGELKHGTLGNETYSNKADTYGLMLSIDRRDIINDDLGAITTVPQKLGRGSGLKINDVFWTIFLNNAAFFVAGNNNYIVGAGTALGIDGLTAGEVTFLDQVDGDGKPIGIMPAILLVPTALSAIGSQLFKSMELRDNTSTAKYPITNPHQGKFRVEVTPVDELPFAALATKNPPVGTEVWHMGYGIDRPGNREDGRITGAETADGQLQMELSVSSGDSGGGIFRADTNELVAVVCCTTERGRKVLMFGGSAERAARMRPVAKTDTDVWEPLAIPVCIAKRTDADWRPIDIPVRRK